jgi:hypothetical protein
MTAVASLLAQYFIPCSDHGLRVSDRINPPARPRGDGLPSLLP